MIINIIIKDLRRVLGQQPARPQEADLVRPPRLVHIVGRDDRRHLEKMKMRDVWKAKVAIMVAVYRVDTIRLVKVKI